MAETKVELLPDSISPFASKPTNTVNEGQGSTSPFRFAGNVLDKSINGRKGRKFIGPYQLSKTLGSGSMGKVKLAVHSETGEKFAVKIIPRKAPIHKGAPKDDSRDIRIHREIALMVLLNHPYIVSLKEAMIMPQHYYLFFEYVSGGQILDYIISHGKLKERNARKFARQMLSAIDYCHKHSIVHRDLKIENILITDKGNIKIIDFGLSNLFSTKSQLNTFCGSLYFAAPELLSAQQYTGPEVDVWSLGIVFYVLVCGRVPFDDPNMPALHAKIKKGDVSYPNWLSKECKNLLSRMLVTNPSQRASMAELLRHPWINKGYDTPIEDYIPLRAPIELPLDMNVIQRMKGFEFGNEEKIKQDLENIINNKEMRIENSTKVNAIKKVPFFQKNKTVYDQINFNHPLVSIYYLVKEKLERENNPNHQTFNIPEQEEPASSTTYALSASLLNGLRPIQPEITLNEPDSPYQDNTEHQRLTKHSPEIKTPNVLKRLSSAMKPSKSVNLHRLSHGPGHDTPKPNVGSRIGRRISKLITRHLSMQEPKMGNSLTELDSLMDHPPNNNALLPSPSSPNNHNITAQSSHIDYNKNSDEVNRPHDCTLKPRTASLKGLFSVSTTSTKKAKVITEDIVRALKELGIRWKHVDGYFECHYCPDMTQDDYYTFEDSNEGLENDRTSNNNSKNTSPSLQPESNVKGSPESTNSTRIQTARIETAAKLTTVSNEPTSNRVVKFQIQLVRIKVVLRLHGIQFRRLEGPSWEYKAICSKVLAKLKL